MGFAVARTAIYVYLIAIPPAYLALMSISGYDLARVAQCGVALLCSAGMLWGPGTARHGQAPWPRARLAAGLAAALLAVLSIAGAAHPGAASREAALWLGMAAIATVAAGHDARARRDLAWAAAGGLLLYGLLLMAIALAWIGSGIAPRPDKMAIGHNNYRHFNHVQTIGLPLLAAIAAAGAERRLRALAATGLVVHAALVLFFMPRGTTVALVASATVVTLWAGRGASPLLRSLGLGVAGGAALWLLVFHALPRWAGVPVDLAKSLRADDLGTAGVRVQLWERAAQLAAEKPWLGVGPMHYADLAGNPGMRAAHPHNLYLQLAAEWGLPLTVAAIAAAGGSMLVLLRTVRRCAAAASDGAAPARDCTWGAGLAVAVLAAALDAVVSGNLVAPVSQVWAAVAVGWAWAWWRDAAPPTAVWPGPATPPARGRRRRAAAALLLASQLALAVAIATDLPRLRTDRAMADAQASGEAKPSPRFWLDGGF